MLFIVAHSSCKVSGLCSVRDKVLLASWPGKTRKWDFLLDLNFFHLAKDDKKIRVFALGLQESVFL